MAAKKIRGTKNLDQQWRDNIKAGVIMQRLCSHVDGKVEMTATQIQAAKVVLGKMIPDLKAIEHGGSMTVLHEQALDALK